MEDNIKSFESEILKKIVIGDTAALTYLYNKYAKKVYALSYYILKDRYSSEDIVQEVSIHLWDNREEINHTKDVWLLLYIYTKQKSLNKLKSILRYEKHKDNHWKNIAKDYQNVDDYLDFKEMQQSMYSAVSCLTPTQQKIFLLSREEGLSHSEIAEKLNISQNTVKNHMVTALTTLRKFFKDHEIMTLAIFIGIN